MISASSTNPVLHARAERLDAFSGQGEAEEERAEHEVQADGLGRCRGGEQTRENESEQPEPRCVLSGQQYGQHGPNAVAQEQGDRNHQQYEPVMHAP